MSSFAGLLSVTWGNLASHCPDPILYALAPPCPSSLVLNPTFGPRYDEIVEPRTFYMDQHPYSYYDQCQQGHLGSADHHGTDDVNMASVVEAELAVMEANAEAMRCFGELRDSQPLQPDDKVYKYFN